MSKLFSTFSRAALVAIGLSVAPTAFAQGTFSCPTGFAPIFAGTGTQSVEATCGVTCPSGQVASVNGATVSCAAGGGGDVAPGGCTLSASPSSGSSATNVTLTYKCTSGTLPISVAWQGGTPPGTCLDTMDALTKTCTVTGVAQTTTWTVSQFSNTVGNGSNNANKSASFTFQQGGGGGFASCPSGAYTVPNGWFTNQAVSFGTGTIYSYEMPIPASGSTTNKISNDWGYYGAVGDLEYNITTVACDFSGNSDVLALDALGKAKPGTKYHFYNNTGVFSVQYKVGQNLQAGQTYYFNIRSNNCPAGMCTEYGNLKKP